MRNLLTEKDAEVVLDILVGTLGVTREQLTDDARLIDDLGAHRLYRYRDRLELADQLQIADDNAPAIQNLLFMLAGKQAR